MLIAIRLGEHLAEELEARGTSAAELARKLEGPTDGGPGGARISLP